VENEGFVCKGCRKRRPRNSHLAFGVQQFCAAPACQRERRTRWQRERLRSDPAYKAAQREADACWRENSAPDYHKEYRADLKKPAAQRRQRRPIRPRARRRALVVALGALELRVSLVPAGARSRGVDGGETRVPDVELALIRVQRAADGDAVRDVSTKDGRVPSPESLTGSQMQGYSKRIE
jgi:hypothetical protein